jgi:hypothetical protein
MPESDSWKGGYLIGLIPGDDLFLIKWKKHSSSTTLPGIWRVHSRRLFTGTRLLPIPKDPARLPQSTNPQVPRRDRMATKKAAGTKAPAKKKASSAKATTKAADTNGAKKPSGRTRQADKLEGLTEARRRNVAKLIFRERSKSPATSWPDITQMIEEKYDWTLPGSMTGRRLLRDYGPENAEEAIIQQDRSATKKKAKAVTTKAKKGKAKAAPVVEDVEDEDLEDEDEELDEDDDIEDEADLEDEEDEDEDDLDDDDDDEDEEDEEEEEPPAKAKKVRVTKGRGKKANPSK